MSAALIVRPSPVARQSPQSTTFPTGVMNENMRNAMTPLFIQEGTLPTHASCLRLGGLTPTILLACVCVCVCFQQIISTSRRSNHRLGVSMSWCVCSGGARYLRRAALLLLPLPMGRALRRVLSQRRCRDARYASPHKPRISSALHTVAPALSSRSLHAKTKRFMCLQRRTTWRSAAWPTWATRTSPEVTCPAASSTTRCGPTSSRSTTIPRVLRTLTRALSDACRAGAKSRAPPRRPCASRPRTHASVEG